MGYPTYSLGGGGTIYPDSSPAGVTTRSPRMVTECLLTRWILIKNVLPFHGMCMYMNEGCSGSSWNLVIKCSNIDILLSCFDISQVDIMELVCLFVCLFVCVEA